jgi:hypothetical protein
MGIITDIAGDKKKKKPFKHLKSAGTRWKTLEQPPTTTKTTFNGQTSRVNELKLLETTMRALTEAIDHCTIGNP